MNSFEQPTSSSNRQEDSNTEAPSVEERARRYENLPGIPPYAEAHREHIEQQFAEAERLRDEIKAMAAAQAAPDQAPDEETSPGSTLHPYIETYTEFTKCEVCHGSGRRLLFFRCPACNGKGSIPASTSMKTGYYGSRKPATAIEESEPTVSENTDSDSAQ